MSPFLRIRNTLQNFSGKARYALALVLLLTLLNIPAFTPVYAAGFTVNTTNDTVDVSAGNGICADAVGDCSLRAAMEEANALAGADTITVPAGTYTLGSQLPAVTTTMTITGSGETNTIVQASTCNPVTLPGGCTPATYRVLEVNGGNLTLDGLTVRHGYCNGCGGGGLYSMGNLIASHVTFSSNSATSGGGVYNFVGVPTLTNVTFSNNSADFGGGMLIDGGNPMLTNVTFSGNSAAADGGGIYNFDGDSTLTNVTFSGNSATNGSGMLIRNSRDTLTNVTFSSNSATSSGGGIFNLWGNPTLTNVTFNGNSATDGGGIYNLGRSFTLKNVIIANSTGGDCYGIPPIASNTLIESTGSDACGLTNGVDGNIIGSDPNLGALGNNGGFTQTHALLAGSPAIDAGANCAATDQRGVTRPQGTACDIGAYEYVPPLPPTATFGDVPINYWAWQYIEAIYNAGITGGCSTSPMEYCPTDTVTRAQMAVFLLRGIHGRGYIPPAATGAVFGDVPADLWSAKWIEQLSAEGLTNGCGDGNYCPDAVISRAEMSIFLLRAKYGKDYVPPTATGAIFADVPAEYWAAGWIEQLLHDGISKGCGNNSFCPEGNVTRDQMAVFLQKTFNLPLP